MQIGDGGTGEKTGGGDGGGTVEDATIFITNDNNGQDEEGSRPIRGTAHVGRVGEKTREGRLRWNRHVRRKNDGCIGRRLLRMELSGMRKRGRQKRRFMDVVKEDMAKVEVTKEDTEDRNNWTWKIRCGDPWW